MPQLNLQTLLDKKMNRKEFLAHIGAGALAVVGISGLVKTMLNYSGTPHRQVNVANGYGSSSYGGRKRR